MILHTLSSTFREAAPNGLALVTQDGSIDTPPLAALVPLDQKKLFEAEWSVNDRGSRQLVFTLVESATCHDHRQPDPLADEVKRLAKLDDAELQTLAAEQGVEWDTKASRETMVQRIAEALATAPAK
jgi:hypothetical protein